MTGQPSKHRTADRTRRRILLGSAVALVGAAALTPVALAVLPEDAEPVGKDADGTLLFDEMYKGRRIEGRKTVGTGEAHGPGQGQGHHGHGGHAGHGDPGVRITVDGKELHVMRNADGTWVSVLNHYQVFDDLRDVARAAVDELDGAKLIPLG
ncbi:tyrosinase [Streptomyces sp. NA04227]|uniref:apotyrosinase chaperone MelC1 n=1 Tax=Streptomyces sp. NA04227 TaxID=2742136 RepID=UPI00158FC500|nr:tyrosinase family oxidase copper chaperone [Streptomyces sp. NA04227]QKW06085.1 tyrosinase [Streptomyces sp. NA04227]